jgi:hypothetical protein
MAAVISTRQVSTCGHCRDACVKHLLLNSAFAAANVATTTAIHDFERALLDVERCFPDCFAQSRVRVTGAAEIFGAAAEFDYRNSFGD